MYERFTDRARKIMQLANQEAQRFNHEYIGTEHILLGLIQEGTGVAANVIHDLHVDPRKIKLEVEKLIQCGRHPLTLGKLPHTPRAKSVIQRAMQEARDLNHNYVGSEHILLGLLREGEGVAAVVLNNCGVTWEAARSQTLALLGHETCSPSAPQRSETPEESIEVAPKRSAACPHCGRPYRTGWSLSPLKMLRRLFGR
jgi:ATP-dependent Clp protease ATP-binding subunit ClpC